MKNLIKVLGLSGGLLFGCDPIDFPEIKINLAQNLFRVDTSNIDFPADSATIDSLWRSLYGDSIYWDTSSQDTIIQDTIIIPDTNYVPKDKDGNVQVLMEYPSYKVGDLAAYSFRIMNLIDDTLMFNNSTQNRAVLCKMYCGNELVLDENIDENFNAKLYKKGYFGVRKSQGYVEIYATGVEIEFDKVYNVPFPLEVSVRKEANDFYFEKSGEYHIEVFAKYKKNDKTIESKFYSEKFEVEE